jgi:hypothetical protein
MTAADRPYTDADLRTEAARQHKTLTEDPDFMGIGEQMGDTAPWDSLGDDDFETAQRAVDDLLGKAADVSKWAVNLGADGLEPSPDQITVSGDDRPIARIHVAVTPDMPTEVRAALIEGLGSALADLF